MNTKAQNLLYRSFDVELSQEEQNYLNKALSLSKELRVEHEELKELRLSLSEIKIPAFSDSFSEEIMKEIVNVQIETVVDDSERALWNLYLEPLKPLAIAALLCFVVLGLYDFYSPDQATGSEVTVLELSEISQSIFLELKL